MVSRLSGGAGGFAGAGDSCAAAVTGCAGVAVAPGEFSSWVGAWPSFGTSIASAPEGRVTGWPAISSAGFGTTTMTSFSESRFLPLSSVARTENLCWPGSTAESGSSTHSPRSSASAEPTGWPLSSRVILLPGAARPAITASPFGLTRTTSKLGLTAGGWGSGGLGGGGLGGGSNLLAAGRRLRRRIRGLVLRGIDRLRLGRAGDGRLRDRALVAGGGIGLRLGGRLVGRSGGLVLRRRRIRGRLLGGLGRLSLGGRLRRVVHVLLRHCVIQAQDRRNQDGTDGCDQSQPVHENRSIRLITIMSHGSPEPRIRAIKGQRRSAKREIFPAVSPTVS